MVAHPQLQVHGSSMRLGPTPLGIGQKTAPRRALLVDGTKIIDADERDLFCSWRGEQGGLREFTC